MIVTLEKGCYAAAMKHFSLKELIFAAICADIGILLKKVIAPLSNMITGALHIPGGIGSAFSAAFVVVGTVLIRRFGAGIWISLIQCLVAVAIGGMGSMGPAVIFSYLLSGLCIDLVLFFSDKFSLDVKLKTFFACIAASAANCLSANIIVFRLYGIAFVLYLLVSLFSGSAAGYLAAILAERLMKLGFTGSRE